MPKCTTTSALFSKNKGTSDGAKSHLERSTVLAPHYALLHANLGMVLAKVGETKDATQHLETALRLDPEQYMAHNSFGELVLKEEKLEETQSHFEQALRIDPDYAPAKKNLAAMNVVTPK
jgi:Tfp pilus assembly protein PilF